ncbi:MAG: flagellar protein FliT [Gammaproteobacteria bacterium]|nr:flagellar protein FliT [Gammaproteobacteria bacterium]
MYDRNLTEVLRLTAEMENRAADGEWGVVQELDAVRLVEMGKLSYDEDSDVKDKSEVFSCLLQSNRTITSLARKAKSKLKLEQQQLLRGRQATGSYQQIQGSIR